MWQTLRHQWQCRERGGGAIRHIRHSIRAAVRARYSANGRELIKDMCCRPLGSPLPTGSQSIKSVNASSVNNWGDGSQASHHSFDISFVWRQKSDILPPIYISVHFTLDLCFIDISVHPRSISLWHIFAFADTDWERWGGDGCLSSKTLD